MSSQSKIALPGTNDIRASTAVRSQPGFANIQEDILTQIFLLLARSYYVDLHYEPPKWDWASVSEVCRYWHAVATGYPRLWSFIDNFRWTKRFQMSMRLSKRAPLTISFLIPGDRFDVEFGNLKIAMKEMGRICYFALHARFSEVQAADLFPYFNLPAPLMHTMDISTSAFKSLPHFHPLYTSPDVLRRVTLHGIESPLISGTVCLSELTLENCSFSLSQLSGVLVACPALKRLDINSCRIHSSDSSNTKSAYLPFLEYLHIYHGDVNTGLGILQIIEAPNTSFWEVYSKGRLAADNSEKIKAISKFLNRDDHFDELRINATYSATLGDGLSYFNFGGSGGRLNFEFYQEERDAMLQCFIEIFRGHLTRISLLDTSASEDNISTETWGSLFKTCTSSKVLKISLDYETLEGGPLFGTLVRRPRSIEELGGSFPDLEHLFVKPYLGGTNDIERLVDDLKDLYERRSANGFPTCTVTVTAPLLAQPNCTLPEGLEGIGVLRQWAEAVLASIRKWDEDDEGEIHEVENENIDLNDLVDGVL